MIDYEVFRQQIEKLKRERWASILAGEPAGQPVRRRPRDPEHEEILLQLDRARQARHRRASGSPDELADPPEGDDDRR